MQDAAVAYLHVVGIDFYVSAIEIHHCGVAWGIYSEEIEPRRILAEFVGIVSVLGRSLSVANENTDSAAALRRRPGHQLNEPLASCSVNAFIKHNQNISYSHKNT